MVVDMKKVLSTIVIFLLMLVSCQHSGKETTADNIVEEDVKSYIERVDTLGLIVLYPQYSRVDLVCGTMPSKSDSTVLLVAEAAYTGECLKEFKHTNIAGDHVSQGKRFKGFRCKRNTGAFVFYNGAGKFCQEPYSAELDAAASHGGAGFGQELIMHRGKSLVTARKDANRNQFRALCCHAGRLCIIESDKVVTFGDFRKALVSYGVSDAIYLDMGRGWNHAWYRDGGEVIELHPKTHNYCTNWITFYK